MCRSDCPSYDLLSANLYEVVGPLLNDERCCLLAQMRNGYLQATQYFVMLYTNNAATSNNCRTSTANTEQLTVVNHGHHFMTCNLISYYIWDDYTLHPVEAACSQPSHLGDIITYIEEIDTSLQ